MSSATPAVSVYPVTVLPHTVRIGDIIRVRGTNRSVRDMRFVSGGAKRLILDGGGTYTLGLGEPVLVFRHVAQRSARHHTPAA